ncbi:hypothetical protein MMPV_008327 [Pyropia vietnamensis]
MANVSVATMAAPAVATSGDAAAPPPACDRPGALPRRPPPETLAAVTKELRASINDASRAAAALPVGDDAAYLAAVSPAFETARAAAARQVQELLRGLSCGGSAEGDGDGGRKKGGRKRKGARAATDSDSDSYSNSDVVGGTGGDGEDPVALFAAVTDATDGALEAALSALDDATGVRSASAARVAALAAYRPPGGDWRRQPAYASAGGRPSRRGGGPAAAGGELGAGPLPPRLVEMPKPQYLFPDWPIDNRRDTPFVAPVIDGVVASAAAAAPAGNSNRSGNCIDAATGPPLDAEMRAAAVALAAAPLPSTPPRPPRSNEDTPFAFIDTEADLTAAVARLRATGGELAVDLEAHSTRTFQGFTCLIQISSREEDLVLDALALRGSLGRALHPLFADPTVPIVMHGADGDAAWLHRDFGLRLVGLYDTGQAARVLGLPSLSLSYLLSTYAGVASPAKKAYQMADWRLRPLPPGMLAYARSDTHSLLYIYDQLRVAVAAAVAAGTAPAVGAGGPGVGGSRGRGDVGGAKGRGPGEHGADVWARSAVVARTVHVKPTFDPGAARVVAARRGARLNPPRRHLLSALWAWRDATARDEDESTAYVAPEWALLGLAAAPARVLAVPASLVAMAVRQGAAAEVMRRHAPALVALAGAVLAAPERPPPSRAPRPSVVAAAATPRRSPSSAAAVAPATAPAVAPEAAPATPSRPPPAETPRAAAVRPPAGHLFFSASDADSNSGSDKEGAL